MCIENPESCTDGTDREKKKKQPHIKDSIDLLSEDRLASELIRWGRLCSDVEKHSGWWHQQGVHYYADNRLTANVLHWPDKMKYDGASISKLMWGTQGEHPRAELSMRQLCCLLVVAGSALWNCHLTEKKKKKAWAHKKCQALGKRFEQKKCTRTASSVKINPQILN